MLTLWYTPPSTIHSYRNVGQAAGAATHITPWPCSRLGWRTTWSLTCSEHLPRVTRIVRSSGVTRENPTEANHRQNATVSLEQSKLKMASRQHVTTITNNKRQRAQQQRPSACLLDD